MLANLPPHTCPGPASGSGFTELAGYIFGGNKEQVRGLC